MDMSRGSRYDFGQRCIEFDGRYPKERSSASRLSGRNTYVPSARDRNARRYSTYAQLNRLPGGRGGTDTPVK